MSTGISCNIAVLHGHENLSFACIFKNCGLKENSFRYMYTLSVRLFVSAVRVIFCRFIGLERLNTDF